MKLLFDENLSHRLVDLLAVEFPHSSHPKRLKNITTLRQRGWQIVEIVEGTPVFRENLPWIPTPNARSDCF